MEFSPNQRSSAIQLPRVMFTRNNFTTKPVGDGAWIIRNSWGSSWGDDGCFYLSYYDEHVGADVSAFHNSESVNNYKDIYQYDPLGNTSAGGYKSNSAWGGECFYGSFR